MNSNQPTNQPTIHSGVVMVACDYDEAKKNALLKDQGYHVSVSRE